MKKVQTIVYEKGDFVEITKGYRKGMVGVVVSHDLDDNEVNVVLADDNTEDDPYDRNRGIGFNSSSLKYLDKKAYDEGIKRNKILRVKSLPVALQFKGKSLRIGDNVVTAGDAKLIVKFINSNMKKKGVK